MDKTFDPALPAEMAALNRAYCTVRYDADGKIAGANTRFLRLLGRSLEELIGQDPAMFLSKSADRSEHAALWAQLKAGQAAEDTTLYIAADGAEVWLRSQLMPLEDAAGAVREIVQIAEDVTDTLAERCEAASLLEAIDDAYAAAQFAPDGTAIFFNERFGALFGYAPGAELSHGHLVAEPRLAAEASALWARLLSGGRYSGEVRRLDRHGRDVWLQCVYSPATDAAGRIQKIVLYGVDVTEERMRQADYESQVTAIRASNCVATYDMHGTILDANPLFLEAMGFAETELIGRHHHIFVAPTDVHGTDYAAFWNDLRKGRHRAGQFKRFGKGGREVWLQASYNPIFDAKGDPVRVVEYASPVTDERMVQAEQQGQIAALHAAQCVLVCSLDGTVLDANENFLDRMGYRFAEVRGQAQSVFVPEEVAGCEGYRALWRGLRAGEPATGEFKHVAKNGEEVWFQCAYNPILDLDGRPAKVTMYASDVTAEKLTRADHTAQIEAIQRTQCVVVFDMDGVVREANANFLAAMKYDADELIGAHHAILVDRDYASSRSYVKFWEGLRAGRPSTEMCKRIAKDGAEVWFQASYSPINDLNGEPVKIIKYATDVTSNVSLAEAFEDAKRQAHHDPATSLPNRAKLSAFMDEQLAEPAAEMAVFYIDIDRFKTINDSCGHHVGDRVLGEVADRLRRVLRDEQMVARIGGDEFVIAAPRLPFEAVERLTSQVFEAFREPVRHDGGEIAVGLSVGIASAPTDGRTPDALLRAADAALYRAKEEGRGCFRHFDSAMNDRIAERRRIIADMRDGLTAGEFYLEYQPRWDAASRTVTSAEALVRWRHPERGRVAPADFIALAEQSGLIVPLGRWVLEEACRAAADWKGAGVSVNVSPVQFRDPAFVETVEAALKAADIPPAALEIEVTEGVLIDDAASAIDTLGRLKALGVRLAMDDFGTGFSSLSYLRNFPFDVIKIDRSFIGDLESSDSARPIIQAVIALARSLGMSVTAEGVETDRQLTMLTEDACNEVQGYLMAKPLPLGEVQALFCQARHRAA